MIISFRAENFMVFKDKFEISFQANNYIKKFDSFCYECNDDKIVKSSCIYGPNNVGKSCLVDAISILRSFMLGYNMPFPIGSFKNFYSDNEEISLGLTALIDKKKYSFDCTFYEPSEKYPEGRFIYEKFVCFDNDSKRTNIIYLRDDKNKKLVVGHDSNYEDKVKYLGHSKLFPFMFDKGDNEDADKIATLLKEIGSSILVFVSEPNSPANTINELKENPDSDNAKFIKDMIRGIDVGIDDFYYEKNENNPVYKKLVDFYKETSTKGRETLFDQCSLYSIHNGKKVESIAYDSEGTKEIISLSSYVVDALNHDKTLFIDSFDNGLHEKVLRSIISMFNSETNKCAQLIFTAQNSSLIDTRTLFRKDQIWFLDRKASKKKGVSPQLYLYRLDEFTSLLDHVRSETDVETRYRNGDFGAVPQPDLFKLMVNMSEKTCEH